MATAPVGLALPRLLPITGTWTLPFAVYLGILTTRVILQRRSTRTAFGSQPSKPSQEQVEEGSQHHPLQRAVSAHSNFTENVPFALTLAAIAELNGANKTFLNWTLGALFVARVAHVEFGVSKPSGIGGGRPLGVVLTSVVVTGLASWTGWLVKGYWRL